MTYFSDSSEQLERRWFVPLTAPRQGQLSRESSFFGSECEAQLILQSLSGEAEMFEWDTGPLADIFFKGKEK